MICTVTSSRRQKIQYFLALGYDGIKQIGYLNCLSFLLLAIMKWQLVNATFDAHHGSSANSRSDCIHPTPPLPRNAPEPLRHREHCIIDLFRTWSKILTAARVINAIPTKKRKAIFVLSARPFAQKAVKEFAKQMGATAIEGGNSLETFAAQLHSSSIKPRLLIVADSKTDRKAVAEAFHSNIRIPVIAFGDTDASMRYVDIGIPGNLTNKHCIGCLFWLLGKMVHRMRDQSWNVPIKRFVCDLDEEGEVSVEFADQEEKERSVVTSISGDPTQLENIVYDAHGWTWVGPKGPPGEYGPRVILDTDDFFTIDLGRVPHFRELTREELNQPLWPDLE